MAIQFILDCIPGEWLQPTKKTDELEDRKVKKTVFRMDQRQKKILVKASSDQK